MTGELKKSEFGGWMMPVFRVLASLKRLRGGMLDIFGYSEERRMERRLIGEYEATVETLLATLSQDNHAARGADRGRARNHARLRPHQGEEREGREGARSLAARRLQEPRRPSRSPPSNGLERPVSSRSTRRVLRRPEGPSRRRGTSTTRLPTRRDALLRSAPQGEVVFCKLDVPPSHSEGPAARTGRPHSLFGVGEGTRTSRYARRPCEGSAGRRIAT